MMSSLRRRGARTAAAVAVCLIGVSLTVLVPSTPAMALPSFRFTRLAGVDRYDTARLIAETRTSADNALLATGENFPDALAGNYLAGVKDAPILLTAGQTLSPPAAEALSKLNVKNVTLLGGPVAISTTVENDLKAKGLHVDRIAGQNRYQTAQLIATAPGQGPVGSDAGKRTAFVVSGENFPDALASGPLSSSAKLPTLLTAKSTLSPEAKPALQSLNIQRVLA